MLFGHTSSRDGCTMCGESTHSTQPPLRKLTVYSVALLCVRVRKSNFWENSFTTFSSVPVSRVSIQVYFTQVKITILFYMYFFPFFSFIFSLCIFHSFVCFAVLLFSANRVPSARFVATMFRRIQFSHRMSLLWMYIVYSWFSLSRWSRIRSTIFVCEIHKLLILPCASESVLQTS